MACSRADRGRDNSAHPVQLIADGNSIAASKNVRDHIAKSNTKPCTARRSAVTELRIGPNLRRVECAWIAVKVGQGHKVQISAGRDHAQQKIGGEVQHWIGMTVHHGVQAQAVPFMAGNGIQLATRPGGQILYKAGLAAARRSLRKKGQTVGLGHLE